MEINHLLKDVIHLNEYTVATQDVINKFKNIKVTINIATVLTLKKIRSLEIEYLNKCDENGVACIIFERLLATPPSKVWGVLAKELVYLLQYWLEAIRKHLVNHSTRWWMFLKLILKFIKEIRLKDPSIPNMLVELTAECLFDLSTASRPDVFQRHEILHSLNMVCAESSREIRFAMRTKFGEYFVKIASQMATCGYLPAQYSSLECLLRWLVPRQEPALRAAAAARWLPPHLCPQPARDLFLSSSWMNFFQDARDFLNALNKGNGLVKSVICRRLCIGEVAIINGTEKQQSWLDFNSSGRSVSMLLDPKVLEVFGVREHRACETLVVDDEITETALLRRESLGLTISLDTVRAPYIRPTELSAGESRRITIVVSSRTDLRALDEAMKTTFRDKYQLLIDLDTDMSQSPQRSYKNKNELNMEEDTRFSHPVEIKRRKHCGYIVRTKHSGGEISPSTASTSSLIQLKDRLAALPRYKYDKEPVSVCAQPALSNVTELTEQDDRSIYTGTTVKFQPYGVCHKSFKTRIDQITESKSRSDGETVKLKNRGGRRLLSPVVSDDNSTSLLLVATVGSTNDSVINETIERLSKSKDFQDDNIVNLLVQEAMQAKPKSREVSDSGINTDDKKSQGSEAIDDTPNELKELKSRLPLKKVCTIVSKSTTDDESNTEAINETPTFVNTRKVRGSINPKPVESEKTYNVKSVEEFFSQHIAENKKGEIVISPTLAKKINESSSETSENFDEQYLLMNDYVYTDVEQTIFNDIDVVDCLNNIVDKVCSDFDKCTEYLFKDTIKSGNESGRNTIDAMNETSDRTPKSKPVLKRPKRNIKLKYKPVKKTKTRVTKKIKNAEQEKIAKMSTIVEQTEEDTSIEEMKLVYDIENMVNINENHQDKPETSGIKGLAKMSTIVEQTEEDTSIEEMNLVYDIENMVNINENHQDKPETSGIKGLETPIRRRKRKLYSPKDDDVEKEVTEITGVVSDDVPISEMKTRKNTKTTATCYKELERERKKYTRVTKSRKSKAKVLEMPSPRTVKMDSIFDNLKQTVDSNEKITFVEKNSEVYNFTSESDDDDFKKKVEIKKRVNTTNTNLKSGKKGRNTRQRRAKDTDSSYDEIKTIPVKRKKVAKRTTKRNTESKISAADLAVDLVGDQLDLVDEKMRDAREDLNTSIVIDKHIDLQSTEAEPVLIERPRMEEIYESVSNETLVSKVDKKAPVRDSDSNDTMISKKTTKKLHDSASNDTLNRRTTRKATKTDLDQTKGDKLKDIFASKKVNKKVNKKTEMLQIKKEKGLAKKDKIVIDRDDGTMSPLPGLLVESMPNLKEDVNDSLTTNMLQKFKRIYKDGPDVINDSTQNMLSDVERFNHSAQNCISIVDEIFYEDNKANVASKVEKDVYQRKKEKTTKIIKITDDIETINIPDTINIYDQSDKSIESDGINAHGDLDEAPPNPETIIEELQPRELQDLDQSMRDYFNKLTREIHRTKGGEVENSVDKNKSAISPIVSVKRLSFEDISKWMPSRRTSDTDSSETSKAISQSKITLSPKRTTQLNNSDETTPKSISTKKTKIQETSTPESTKSPIVAVSRISLEEFDKWLPMPKSFETKKNVTSLQKKSSDLKLVYKTRSKSKLKTPPNKRESKKTAKENAHALIKSDSDSDTNDTHNFKTYRKDHEKSKKIPTISALNIPITMESSTKKCMITKTTALEENTDQNVESPKTRSRTVKKVVSPAKAVGKSKPTISPIKLNEPSNIENSSDDECLKKIRRMFAKVKEPKKPNKTVPKESKRKSTSPILSESKKRRIGNVTNVDEPKTLNESKKIEVLEDVVISESGPSISSVNDWFRRTVPVVQRDTSLSYKDTIQNVMEKLDTTLVEINQNTSKKFVNLFVESQRKLGEQKDEHRKLYKKVASDLITEMVRVMDEKFAELDSKSQEMGTSFMEKLKQQAFDLIRDDCKQKRAMVLLLKQDVQAVMDHIERNTSTGSQ